MKDPHLAEQHNSNPTSGPFAHFRSKLHKESFNIPSRQAAADRASKDQLQGALVPALQQGMVPPTSTSGQLCPRWRLPPSDTAEADPERQAMSMRSSSSSANPKRGPWWASCSSSMR